MSISMMSVLCMLLPNSFEFVIVSGLLWISSLWEFNLSVSVEGRRGHLYVSEIGLWLAGVSSHQWSSSSVSKKWQIDTRCSFLCTTTIYECMYITCFTIFLYHEWSYYLIPCNVL